MNALVVGIATCFGGIILVLRHLHVWREQTDAAESPEVKRSLWNQLRRRVLTSTCIAILGFVIALFHFREYWVDRPTSWVILVCCSLVLTVMILCLAVFDMLAVSNTIFADKEKTSNAAQELAKEYHRLKQKAADNQETDSGSKPDKADSH